MPHRWLSLRGRKEQLRDTDHFGNTQNSFDFAFTKPPASVECHEIQNVEVLRPTTSAGDRDRYKRKPDLTLLIERPKSSDSAYLRTPSSARLDPSRIGLAFGSPRHPPQEFASMAASIGPQLQQVGCCGDNNKLLPVTRAKKWKLSPFFKQRSDLRREVPHQHTVNNIDINKLGLPIQRTPWRNPRSPPVGQVSSLDDAPPPLPEKDARYQNSTTRTTLQPNGVPALEINIPKTPLDRVSIMFKDVDGFEPQRLSSRRNRELDSLMLANTMTKPQAKDTGVPKLQRRVTSPTIKSRPELQPGSASQTHLQKYSLFPATPTSTRPLSNRPSPQICRDRIVTVQVPSDTGEPRTNKSVPGSLEMDYSDPSETKQPLRDFKSSSTTSPLSESRVSAGSEIFFDIKSFRDSNGPTGQHHEITRAPPETVQMIRSRSQKQGKDDIKDHEEAATPRAVASPSDGTTAQQIDKTIEIVERLTSPSSSLKKPARAVAEDARAIQQPMQAAQTVSSGGRKSGCEGSFRSRVGSLGLDVPSPVLEAAEEEVLQSSGILQGDRYKTKEEPSSISIPPQGPSSTNIPKFSPPTATMKSLRNIPLSKYAPEHTTRELAKQTGFRPVRSRRSNTDNCISYDPKRLCSYRPVRSSTLPSLGQDLRSAQTTIRDTRESNSRDGPLKITYVPPTAEVSIARTVSLSRKPSTKVTVARHQGRTEPKGLEKVTEKTVALGLAVVQEVDKKHKHGQSVGVILETATSMPSNAPPPLPGPDIVETRIVSIESPQALAT